MNTTVAQNAAHIPYFVTLFIDWSERPEGVQESKAPFSTPDCAGAINH